MNAFQANLAGTDERTSSERHIENVREQGGVFVEAVRLTRMPMLVTDAALPGNPITFANQAFIDLSGYTRAGFTNLVAKEPLAFGRPRKRRTRSLTLSHSAASTERSPFSPMS